MKQYRWILNRRTFQLSFPCSTEDFSFLSVPLSLTYHITIFNKSVFFSIRTNMYLPFLTPSQSLPSAYTYLSTTSFHRFSYTPVTLDLVSISRSRTVCYERGFFICFSFLVSHLWVSTHLPLFFPTTLEPVESFRRSSRTSSFSRPTVFPS